MSIGGISSGADFAASYQLAHSATTLGSAIWAGNAPRCYVTRMAEDDLIRCSDLPKDMSTAGCTQPWDKNQASCDPSVRPCPPGWGLRISKCQGCGGPGSEKRIAAQNVTELVESATCAARRASRT